MKKKEKITVSEFLLICVMLKLLTINEALVCLKTNRLPDNILERISRADKASKN